MKATAGFALFLLFLAGFAFVMMMGRESADRSMAAGGVNLTGVHWRLVSVNGEIIADDSGMFISFDVDGSIKGSGGCNRIFGSLEKTQTGLAIGQLGATRMACPEPIMNREFEFLAALQETSEISTGSDRMHLLDNRNNVLAEFIDDAG